MSLKLLAGVAQSQHYRPDIDGLRALAVLPVVLFHAKLPGFSGGFVGVDVFYVISGYLIGSLLLQDIRGGRFSFISFYERRVRRLFPALFAVLFFSTLAAAALLAPHRFSNFGKSVTATTLFSSNFLFERLPGGYFDETSHLAPLLHTWSLAIEEQFYLLLPAFLIVLFRWARNTMLVWTLGIACTSFLISVWMTEHAPIGAFYTLIPRAWELLLGVLLVMGAAPPITNRAARELGAAIGLALLAWAVCIFTNETSFPGANALIPCVAAALILHTGQEGPSYVRTALSSWPLVFVGAISYSLYLWHWPLLVFSSYFVAGELDAMQITAVIGAAFLLAWLSYRFIERPFRGSRSAFTRPQVFAFGLAASVLFGLLGLAIFLDRGVPTRYGLPTRQLITQNESREQDFEAVCSNWKNDVHSIADIQFCTFGPQSAAKIMFWGDSHLQQLYPLIARLYERGELDGYSVLIAISPGCPPTEHLNGIGKGYHCDRFTTFAMQRAEQSDVGAVFLAFNTWWSVDELLCPVNNDRCVARVTPAEATSRFVQELSERIHKLRSMGKRVMVSLPFPMFDKFVPQLEIRNAMFGKFGLAGVPTDRTLPSLRAQIADIAGDDVFDPRKSLCRADGCLTEIDGVSIYMDNHHIAASQIGILENNFRQSLHALLAPLPTASAQGTLAVAK
jgi:peptidoglycan/LPS O-acetylase OafA/YrhL